ncbi:HlyD family secretion protein [Aureivirga sp. CE67]|uniref:HlyD family secretion protein n=1 Tax=Aureivirga sp. CE67 TaxID=1788983 RepID=UPI0018C9E768|nr:HlyD family efflux transporter periplasmic adaptor subunit [Aureivirga sp. CE67]
MPLQEDDIELRSEEIREILEDVPHAFLRWGNSILFITVFLLLALTWFIKYPDKIAGEATLTTEIPPEKIYTKITSNIDTIFVSNNSEVQKNSVLAVLENSGDYHDIFKLKKIVDTVKSNKAHFYFPFERLDPMLLGEVNNAFEVFETNYTNYILHQKLHPYEGDFLAIKEEIFQANQQLNTFYTQKELQQKELNFQKKELERNKKLHDKGIISTQEYEKKQLEFLNFEKQFKSINNDISAVKQRLATIDKNSKSTEIRKIQDDTQLRKKVVQSFNNLKRAIKDWELKYVLKSSIHGQVSFLNIWHENQNLKQGDLVFHILPIEKSVYISKIQIPRRNSGKIRIGQKVLMKLDNFPYNEFGMLIGNVQSISKIPDNSGNYHIDVVIANDKLITNYKKEIPFQQEMKGTAEIITDDLRLLERVFYQFKKLTSNNNI